MIRLSCILVLIICTYVVTGAEKFTDFTSKCWQLHSGVCVRKTDSCPFKDGVKTVNQPEKGPILCPQNGQKCCVPSDKKDIRQRFDMTCGISKASNFRIIGGWRAMPNEWPWQVSLRQDGGHHCGGSLIHPRWVLTAAHCTFFYKLLPMSVWSVVAADLNTDVDEGTEQVVGVDKIYDHKYFNEPAMANDIALIRLSKPIKLGKSTGIVCLPDPGESFEDMICTVTGYGKTEKADVSKVLLEINKPILTTTQCQVKHCSKGNPIYTANICGGFVEGKRDACQGDSGGPFVCRKRNTKGTAQWILAGAVSYGEGCGMADVPGIYTRVEAYLDWIEYITGLPFYGGEYIGKAKFTYKKPTRAYKCPST